MPVRIHVANPYDRDVWGQSYLLWFGACAPTLVLAYGPFEEALEAAAKTLADNEMFGLIYPYSSDEYRELVAEAREELGAEATDDDIYTHAIADMTYTESGFITSHEWGIYTINPTREQLIKCRRERWPYS